MRIHELPPYWGRGVNYRTSISFYWVSSIFATEFWGKEINVVELPYQPENYDVLLGMDFLAGFRMTLYKSHFTLSIPKE